MTNPFTKSAISSGLLTDGHTEHSSFLMQVTRILTLEKQSLICVLHIALHKVLSTFLKFLENFPQLKSKI
jgi:hypothetical protein